MQKLSFNKTSVFTFFLWFRRFVWAVIFKFVFFGPLNKHLDFFKEALYNALARQMNRRSNRHPGKIKGRPNIHPGKIKARVEWRLNKKKIVAYFKFLKSVSIAWWLLNNPLCKAKVRAKIASINKTLKVNASYLSRSICSILKQCSSLN